MTDVGALIRQLQGALGGVVQRSGSDSVTWPGGSRLTTPTTVLHGLPSAPTSIRLGSSSTNTYVAYSNITDTSFDVTGNTIDGGSPAAGLTRGFSWEASV